MSGRFHHARRCWLPGSAVLALCLLLLGRPAQAVEILPWQRLPLAIDLAVGQERVIFLDKNVQVGMENHLVGKLRVQSAGGALYLLAHEPIEPARLQVKVIESGELILLDIATVTGKAAEQAVEPVRIIDALAAQADEEQTEEKAQQGAQTLGTPVPIALTRLAAQHLYAPLRTVLPLAGSMPVNLNHLPASLPSLLPTRPVQATPLLGFKLGQWQVTAVQLVNQSPHSFALDPRELVGRFYAATFQHHWLGEAGTPGDTTVVYLITEHGGLEKHLLPFAPVDMAQGKEAP